MARGAFAQVDGLARATAGVVDRQRSQPRHLVGIHVQQAGVRIPGRAAPFGAAVKAGVDSGVDADAERFERAVTAQLRELLARPGRRLRRARGEFVGGQSLTRVGRGQLRPQVGGAGDFAWHVRGRRGHLFERKHRLAGVAIQHEHEALLGRLHQRIDGLSLDAQGHERRSRGQIAIQHVVFHELEMPAQFSGGGVERQQAVRIQIVAEAIRSVEIRRRRTGRDEHQPALRIERHAGPAIGAADVLPRVLRPGVVTGLAGLGNGVKAPAQRAGSHVIRAHVAGRGGQGLAHAPADDHEVAIDDAGRGEAHRLRGRLTPEVFAQVDAAVLAEARDGFASGGVQRVHEVVDRREHPRVFSVRPVHEAAIRAGARDAGVEQPELFAGCRVDGEGLVRRRVAEECAPDDDGLGLRVALLAGVVLPRELERGDVAAIDLRERGVPRLAHRRHRSSASRHRRRGRRPQYRRWPTGGRQISFGSLGIVRIERRNLRHIAAWVTTGFTRTHWIHMGGRFARPLLLVPS